MGSPHARLVHAIAAAAGVAGVPACAEDFGGSNIQIDFRSPVPIIAPTGTVPGTFQAPPDTYFTLYAVDQVRDGAGMVTQEYLHEVHRFEIRPAVDLSSPCAIEIEGEGDSIYPGLHIRGFPARVRNALGLAPGEMPDPGVHDAETVTRVTTADLRLRNAESMLAIKAVTSTSVTRYPGVATACVEDDPGVDPALIPPATCIGDASNARRLALCRAVWTGDPLRYEGTDRVLTAPLSGQIHGFVIGSNPVNDAPLGGAGLFVDEVVAADAYSIHYQYKDLDRDGAPDYPASVPAEDRVATGFGYMTGYPEQLTRGVTSTVLVHPGDANISALMSIFADLDEDPVHF
jgi:hypothetical protein